MRRRFGQTIRWLRGELGISQEELGSRSDLDRTYVGGIERGERNPTLLSMLKLARGLGLPASVVLERFERLPGDERAGDS